MNQSGNVHLRRRVEIVERLVEQENLGVDHHCANDTYLLAVSLREITQILLGSHDFIVHKRHKRSQTFLHRLIVNTIQITYKREILLRGQEVNQEASVNIAARIGFPVFRLVDLLSVALHKTIVSLYQVEDKTQQGGLACAVVTYQSYQLALGNIEVFYIQHGCAIIYFLEILYLNHFAVHFNSLNIKLNSPYISPCAHSVCDRI